MTKVLKKREGIPAGQQAVMLATLRNGEATLRWTRAQFFIVIQTPIVLAVGTLLASGATLWRQVFVIFAVEGLGLAVSLIWLAAANRAEKWLKFWNEKIAMLETLERGAAPIRVFSTPKFRELDRDRWSFHWLAGFLPKLTFELWLVTFFFTLTLAVVRFES